MSELEKKLEIYRLNHEEYQKICEILGREPKGLEWAVFSALWSEHCSYKSSKVHLKKFYNQSERVVQSFGENAGVIDLGEGERVAFKMESHNHPSFIEPYQGAATGVGGILRDIFTMGARPVALANYLCFGEPDAERMPTLVDGVVRGIGGYGNCVGVPTITGQTEFHSSYNGNILVNALAVGIFGPEDEIFLSEARGVGNWVVYVGAKTGRDGVHGASMASESFDDDSESKRPNVQIGDPFFEKCLIESCLEVMSEDLVESIQDMGAAGLTSSSFEMASKGKVGLTLHLDQVPIRDQGITPEEILLSESQERMLLMCRPEKFEKLQSVFHRWDLDATCIGEVIEKPVIQLYWKKELLNEISPEVVVDSAPEYERPYKKWESSYQGEKLNISTKSVVEDLKELFKDPRGCSRDWIYRQYDQRVGGKTARDCSSSVGVVRLEHSKRALGVVLGCRPYVMRFDAQVGGMDAIAAPALELSAKGFEPLAVTDCLNFGNPEKEATMSEFVAAVETMSDQCEALNTPVVSGNVSFYNETLGQNITSTPSTGLIGLGGAVEQIPSDHFQEPGEKVFLLQLPLLKIGGFFQEKKGEKVTGEGEISPQKVADFARVIQNLAKIDGVSSSRYVGKGGLAYNLARMGVDGVGIAISDTFTTARGGPENWLSETLYEVIFSVKESQATAFEREVQGACEKFEHIQYSAIGDTQKGTLDFGAHGHLDLKELFDLYHSGWSETFETLA